MPVQTADQAVKEMVRETWCWMKIRVAAKVPAIAEAGVPPVPVLPVQLATTLKKKRMVKRQLNLPQHKKKQKSKFVFTFSGYKC